MSTTDILFNSPALHSLKRAQLIQLCKRHSIKASGKNTDLVSRLQEHARGLPSGSPLSVAVRSERPRAPGAVTDISDDDDEEEEEEESGELELGTSPEEERPSEIWEVVSELGEDAAKKRSSVDSKRSVVTAGSQSQTGEFGTAASSKTTIFQSIASSMGLKRTTSSNSNMPTEVSSDSLRTTTSKKDKGTTGLGTSESTKTRGTLSYFMNRDRSNSDADASQPKPEPDAQRYDEIPASPSRGPNMGPFAFSYDGIGDTSIQSIDRPVPGVGPCSSVKAGDGVGTIRLITSTSRTAGEEDDDTPKLTPVIPEFDLVPPTPGNKGVKRWPMTPEANRSLYPVLNSDDATIDLEALTSPSKGTPKGSGTRSGKPLPTIPRLNLTPKPKEAFVFGSPNPRHSTAAKDFSNAASSVLAEMNARLGAAGGRTIGAEILANAPKREQREVDELLKYEFGGARAGREGDGGMKGGEGSVSSKFDSAHEKAFKRMEGIDTHYAARRAAKEKEQKAREEKEASGPLPDNRKRKQSALGINKGRPSTAPAKKVGRATETRVISNGTRRKMEGKTPMSIPGAFEDDDMEVEELVTPVERDEEDGEGDGDDRGAKRACVADGSGDTGTRRVSVVVKKSKEGSEDDEGDEEMDDEKKRKQNEAIKRHLQMKKARRRTSRGRLSVGPRTPARKEKSTRNFLASAKSLVKSVWNRSGGAPKPPVPTIAATKNASAQASSSGPSYMRGTTSSSSKSLEQEASKPVPAIGSRPSTLRPASVRSTSSGSITGASGLRPKVSVGGVNSANAQPRTVSGSLDTLVEGVKSPAKPLAQSQKLASEPIFGSTRPRKHMTALPRTVAKPNVTEAAAAPATVGRSSRLLAPTASSLAKVNVSPTKASAGTKPQSSGSKARVSVMSPSKIPVFSPPSRKSMAPGAGKGIFSSPLALPSAITKGRNANPIASAGSSQKGAPSLMGVASAFASKTDEAKEHSEASDSKLSMMRKPRISRSKVIAKLGVQREQGTATSSTASRAPLSPSKTNMGGMKGPTTPKVRSSVGVAARRSFGGPKTRDSGAGGVIMSAKKRARATELARRQSTRVPGPNFSKGGDGMEIDD